MELLSQHPESSKYQWEVAGHDPSVRNKTGTLFSFSAKESGLYIVTLKLGDQSAICSGQVIVPTPIPKPVYRPIPISVEQFVADVLELTSNATYTFYKIDSCAEKYPLSVIFYAGKKLLYMEHKDVNIGMIEGLSRELTDPENKGGDYWDCIGETLSVSGFIPFSLYGLKANDENLAIFQRLLIDYLKRVPK